MSRGQGTGRHGTATGTGAEPTDNGWSDSETNVTVNKFTESVGPTFSFSSDSLDTFQHFSHLI